MTDETLRSVELERLDKGRYRATNNAGATLVLGSGDQGDKEPVFSPVELLLAAIGGCGAADVDYITGKRAEPTRFTVRISGHKVRDEAGNRMRDLSVELDIDFPDGEAGDQARAVLPRAAQQSHDRLCTVTRTVELGTQVTLSIAEAER